MGVDDSMGADVKNLTKNVFTVPIEEILVGFFFQLILQLLFLKFIFFTQIGGFISSLLEIYDSFHLDLHSDLRTVQKFKQRVAVMHSI